MRPFLKWLGGKYKMLPLIKKLLPDADTLIEPFVGAGSVFLNLEYKKYIVNDINPHLIALYKIIQADPSVFIKKSKRLFKEKYNTADAYYTLRAEFNLLINNNDDMDDLDKGAIFLYLNRHGFNGLTRFNQQGGFNVPFGHHKKPYFPEEEILYFANKAQKVTFLCEDFTKVLARAKHGAVVYCDPPYIPLSSSANFTNYHGESFSLDQQQHLVDLGWQLAKTGVPVLISNNNTKLSRKLYKGAKIKIHEVQRNISCKAISRVKTQEILALFS